MRTTLMMLLLFPLLASPQDLLNGHQVRLDSSGKLTSWVTPEDKAYDRVIRLAWDFLLKTAPVQSNGLKAYYSYCCLDLEKPQGRSWPHNPACFNAGLAEGAAAYYGYSGDRQVVELVQALLDYQLAHGTTPAAWLWGGVPYASSNHGDTEYRGSFEFQYGNPSQRAIGDGYGVIEPDKVGELGAAYLKFWMLTGESRYRDAALSCANALARNVRAGEWGKSPWPFRVYAETGRIREEYSSAVISTVRLFDELIRLGLGDADRYRKARATAWDWMMSYPMKNMLWSGYFEDVEEQRHPNNLNQYSPMETARYLMQHPDADPEWKRHVPQLIEFVERTFVVDVPREPAVQWGADTVSEQIFDMNKMGSHTSRYASIHAMWHELTGEVGAKDKAYRSFNWASYMCRENGFVNVGPVDQSLWFSDGYGDYIRHFLAGMGSVPEWAPRRENHILRSSSVVRQVSYADGRVTYATFDRESQEVLRLNFIPSRVTVGGKALAKRSDAGGPGWFFDSARQVSRIHHTDAAEVTVER